MTDKWRDGQRDSQMGRETDTQRIDKQTENRHTDSPSYVLEAKKLVNSLKRQTTDRPSAGEEVYLTSDRSIDCDLIND